jgi:hypothetical protein
MFSIVIVLFYCVTRSIKGALFTLLNDLDAKFPYRLMIYSIMMTVITIIKTFNYTHRDAPAIATDISDVIGIKNVTTH